LACPAAFCWRWWLGIAERDPVAPHHVCTLQGAQEGMEEDFEGSLEESLWHRSNARELTRFGRRAQRRDSSNARTNRHLMVDDWLFGSIRHKISGLFLLMDKACCNMTKMDQKENIIASNLLSLASSNWIVADIYLIAGVAKSWLNPHMRWYQGSDPNAGTPGFLCFHRQVQYFLMLEDLKKIEESWREMDEFVAFSKKLLTKTNAKQKQLKEDMAT
jgi:hypothetical protein